MRSSAQVLIYLDVAAAIADGVPLFLSSNQVLLSPGIGPEGLIPAKYFAEVLRASDKTHFDADFPNRIRGEAAGTSSSSSTGKPSLPVGDVLTK